MGTEFLMFSHEKVSPKFFKFHQRFQKTRQNCKQRLLEKICILYGCFEVPMYQDNVCRACSIFVLVVLCRSIVYARTSWTYRYYSIETLFYVYRGPRYTKTMLQLFLFPILLRNLRLTIITVFKNKKTGLKMCHFQKRNYMAGVRIVEICSPKKV